MNTPDEVARLRRALADSRALLLEVKERAITLLKIRAMESGRPYNEFDTDLIQRYLAPILTAYSEVVMECEMVIVPKERWERLTRPADDDWEDD